MPKMQYLRKRGLIYAALTILGVAGLATSTYLLYGVYHTNRPPAFCYIKNQTLECVDGDGRVAKIFSLPKLDGNLISALVPSPDQSLYLASNNGPDNVYLHPNVYVLDKDFNIIKHLDNLIVQDYDLISAKWSADGKFAALKSVYGNVTIYNSTTKNQRQVTKDGVGFYDFSRDGRLVYTQSGTVKGRYSRSKDSLLATINADGSGDKTIALNYDVYAGSYALSRNDIILYHDSAKTYALDLSDESGEGDESSQELQQLAAVPYDYFRYDKATDRLYLVRKTKPAPEHSAEQAAKHETSIASISYAAIPQLIKGAAPASVDLNAPISANDTPFAIPYTDDRIVFAGDSKDRRALMYDLKTGRQVTTIDLPNQFGDYQKTGYGFQDTVPLVVGLLQLTRHFKP